MAQPDDYDQREDPDWFRDELRQRDRLIAELRSELDEANDILRRFASAPTRCQRGPGRRGTEVAQARQVDLRQQRKSGLVQQQPDML